MFYYSCIAPAFRPEATNYLNLALAIKKERMPFVKIWVHAVWTTKNREPLLEQSIRSSVFNHIHKNALENEILMDIVNGHLEHVHCLFRIKNDQSISKIMHLIKGESSFWINQQKITKSRIGWQEGYFAVSVSESQVGAVRKYIQTQDDRHTKETFAHEYDEFIKRYNFQVFNRGV